MANRKEKFCLEKLKKDYQKIKEKYNLPEFNQLNEDFQIEKVSEEETSILIREIRKFMVEKFANYLRFVESILHPVNVSMFVYSVIKTIGTKEKEKLNEIYGKLAKLEVRLVEIDLQFSEEKEIKFVKDSYLIWQEIKKDLLGIVDVIKENWDNKTEDNGKGYFG